MHAAIVLFAGSVGAGQIDGHLSRQAGLVQQHPRREIAGGKRCVRHVVIGQIVFRGQKFLPRFADAGIRLLRLAQSLGRRGG